jgi:hypothetical protein
MIPGLSFCPVMALPPPPIPPKEVTISANTYDVNLRALYNAAGFPAPYLGDTVVFYINSFVIVGASSTGAWALQLGSWPEMDLSPGTPIQPTLNLVMRTGARIQGAGGQGGGSGGGTGAGGGSAFYAARKINMVTGGARLWGGAGGGGGSDFSGGATFFNGGGGAGTVPGQPGALYNPGGAIVYTNAQPGTADAGGAGLSGPGGTTGDGGGPGVGGGSGATSGFTNYGGGGPGYSVYGWGNCTFGTWDDTLKKFTATGTHGADIRGPIL